MIAEKPWILPCNQLVSILLAVVTIPWHFEHRSWFHCKHQRRISICVSNFGVKRLKINEIYGIIAAKYAITVSPSNHPLWHELNLRNCVISKSETTEESPLIKLQLTLSSVMYYFPANIYRFSVVNNNAPPLGVILNQFCISTSKDQRIVLCKVGKRRRKF
jgi:hypothetical protein